MGHKEKQEKRLLVLAAEQGNEEAENILNEISLKKGGEKGAGYYIFMVIAFPFALIYGAIKGLIKGIASLIKILFSD